MSLSIGYNSRAIKNLLPKCQYLMIKVRKIDDFGRIICINQKFLVILPPNYSACVCTYAQWRMTMDKEEKKIGLALSGGGYRAAAYHIGTLRALHKLGILDMVDVISSVSGGSITAAYYALHKDDFEEFEKTFKEKLKRGVLGTSGVLLAIYLIIFLIVIVGVPIFLACCSMPPCCKVMIAFGIWIITLITLLDGQFVILPSSKLIARQYDKNFFENKKLSDLPDSPVLAINATEITYNRIFTFSKIKVAGGDFKEWMFAKDDIPLSFAVMASSAFPLGINPIKFPTEYIAKDREDKQRPYLIDGGIYDNQGCHKFTEPSSSYKADYSIISLAENDNPVYKEYKNSISLLARVINLALNRIDKLQEAKNMYASDNSKQRCAYVVLKWNDNLSLIPLRFLQNAQNGNVPLEVMQMHGFTEEELTELKSLEAMRENDKAKADVLFLKYVDKVKSSIGWPDLYAKRPSKEKVDEAYGVRTSLFGLKNSEIDALGAFSEWMTEVQCKLYLPNLLR